MKGPRIPAGARSARLEATVTRADGTIDRAGMIAYAHRNPIIHFVVNFWIGLKVAVRILRGDSR